MRLACRPNVGTLPRDRSEAAGVERSTPAWAAGRYPFACLADPRASRPHERRSTHTTIVSPEGRAVFTNDHPRALLA